MCLGRNTHPSQPDPEQHHGAVLTLGYTEPDAMPRLATFLAKPQTILLDIRYSPRSRWRPEWNQRPLIERYGVQYVHCRALGNVNYARPGEPIKLVDPEEGVRRVIRLVHNGYAVILLCACKTYERCHRKTAYDLILATLAKEDPTESEHHA